MEVLPSQHPSTFIFSLRFASVKKIFFIYTISSELTHAMQPSKLFQKGKQKSTNSFLFFFFLVNRIVNVEEIGKSDAYKIV